MTARPKWLWADDERAYLDVEPFSAQVRRRGFDGAWASGAGWPGCQAFSSEPCATKEEAMQAAEAWLGELARVLAPFLETRATYRCACCGATVTSQELDASVGQCPKCEGLNLETVR